MKTIEQTLVEECKNFTSPLTPEDLIILVECVTRKYTEQAIKLDRINLLNYVTATLYRSKNDERLDDAVVDEDSLLSAPNIELL